MLTGKNILMHGRRSLHQTKMFDCYACINGVMKMIDNTFFLNDKGKRLYIFQEEIQADERDVLHLTGL